MALCLSLFTGVCQKTANQDACDIVNCNTESTHNNLQFDTVNAGSTLNSETINEEHMDRIKHETNSNEEPTEKVNYKQYKGPPGVMNSEKQFEETTAMDPTDTKCFSSVCKEQTHTIDSETKHQKLDTVDKDKSMETVDTKTHINECLKHKQHTISNNLKKCYHCNRYFKTEKEFKHHVCFFCEFCNTQFISAKLLSEHKCDDLSDYDTDTLKGSNGNKPKTATSPELQQKKKHNVDIRTVKKRPFSNISDIVSHVDDTLIPDDVICSALELMKKHSGNNYLIGQVSPAEMELAVVSSNSLFVSKPKKFCIIIHHVSGHWVTSAYCPLSNTVTVYDSLTNLDRIKQVKPPQLFILYGSSPVIRYVPIKQQGNQPLCGLFAIAAAFSLYIGIPPETQDFDVSKMQTHLKMCLNQQQALMFPTNNSLLDSYFQNQATLQESAKRRKIASDEQFCFNDGSSDGKDKHESGNRKHYFKLYKQNQRSNTLFRSNERIRDVKSKRNSRSDPKWKEKERQNSKDYKKMYRSDPQRKRKESLYEKHYKRNKRSDPKWKEKERQNSKDYKKMYRSDPQRKRKESLYEKHYKRNKRSDPKWKEKERQNSKDYKKMYRSDSQRKRKESLYEKHYKKNKRSDPKWKEIERQNSKDYKKMYRSNPRRKRKESLYEKHYKKNKRLDPKWKEKERHYDKAFKKMQRSNPEREEKERKYGKKLQEKTAVRARKERK